MDALKLPPQERRSCKSCGATLTEDQEWCLQCGAGAPGSLTREADWRPLAVLATVGVILLAGAATAAYAALSQKPSKPPMHVLIAQVPASTTPGSTATPPSTLSTPPATSTPSTTTPSTAFGTGSSSSRTGLPPSTIKPPRLPALVPTPHTPSRLALPTNTGSTPTNTGEPTTPVKTPTTGATEPTNPAANPILLDTNAASTYNPSGYPASYFGDPALAIDGETGTSWTAEVPPSAAPHMAAGLALDLKTARHLGTLELHTSTPGMTLEVFGANASAIPATIVDPAWKKLTPSHLVKKKTATIRLGTGGKAFRFIVLWLTMAPESAVGTPTAPGHISIGEVVPYPPGS
jgi:RNA polymerase subunit RPABC4/transcription elongation factor Spt4